MFPSSGSTAGGFDRLAIVERLCRDAQQLAGEGERVLALASFVEAWELLPEPKSGWGTSTFILARVGDLLQVGGAGGDLSRALDVLVRSHGRTAGAPGDLADR